MNKGLFWHIMVSITVIMIVLFIVGTEDVGMLGRFAEVACFVMANVFTGLFISDTIGYKEKFS